MHRVEKRRAFQCQSSLLHINYHRALHSYTFNSWGIQPNKRNRLGLAIHKETETRTDLYTRLSNGRIGAVKTSLVTYSAIWDNLSFQTESQQPTYNAVNHVLWSYLQHEKMNKSFGYWYRVGPYADTEISEERAASIFSVTELYLGRRRRDYWVDNGSTNITLA
jgi:hypothetical protein